MTRTKAAALALAASLALPAAARAKPLSELPGQTAPKGQDAKQQSELERAQQTHEQGTPRPLDEAQQKAIGEAWARTQVAQQVGQLGQSRGQSQEVKNLGRWLADDARRVSQDLGNLLRARGSDPAKLPGQEAFQQMQGEVGALAKASGEEFDRQYVDWLTRNTPALKDAMGRARDVTPGSDAELKWYLDQGEKLEIGHRDAARQLATQRQARTPPPQQQRAPPPPRPAPGK
jgi:predicted outer membrane protein